MAVTTESYAGKIQRKLLKKQKVIEAASGRKKADLVLKNATFVNVFSNELTTCDPKKQDPVDLVKNIALRGVRQYNISNEKLGNISVVEGKVVNGFNQPRELIRIEASLYDAAGNALVSKQQLAGTSLSLFQLQVLGEQELEQALANKIDIMATNTNVLPGGEVPFMVVFYSPPDNAAEYGVKVIDARIPPENKKN